VHRHQMPQDGQQGHGRQGHIVEGASGDAGPSYTLVFPLFDHGASDRPLDSEQPGGLASERDAEETRIALLRGERGCDDLELVVAEVGGSDVADGDSGTPASSQHAPAVQPASSQDEMRLAWLNDTQDDGAWRDATVQEMCEGQHSYSPEEVALIARGTALLGTFATGKGKARPMRRC
jgi:hypothetical protein